MNRLKTARQVIEAMGWRWVEYRARYALKLRTGYFERKLPIRSWEELPIEEELAERGLTRPSSYLQYRKTEAPAFFFSEAGRAQYEDFFSEWDSKGTKNCVELADRVCEGSLLYFDHHLIDTGFPPDWHKNYFTGEYIDPKKHWSRIDDFRHGDIKVIWEPSRFAFIYNLVRAYWRTGNEKYAEAFWQLVKDWREHNNPNQGPNWKCGQEIAFRIMAWVFGLYGFLTAPATTAERVTSLAQMIAVSAHRIEANLNYALSQRNNHGISEGMGLWTVGLLFPEFRRAEAWLKKGRQVLERLGQELIYDDGSFVQHSVNYHRLMLHDYLWAIRLGDLNEQPLSDALRERVAKATEFLYQIQDAKTGQVPYYGQNDGALILPLNNCDYQDFRPVVQAGAYLATGKRCYASGPWDEDLLWLFGPDALQTEVVPPGQSDFRAEAGGYYALRSGNGFAFVRCATYNDRPGQADMLHVDLWWRGQNIATDAGTYSYNAPEPWDNPLAHTVYHNTVTVDGLDQMDRAGRFLWLPWLRGNTRVNKRSSMGHLSYWEGEHDGYYRLPDPVTHRRGILRMPSDSWLVIDDVAGEEEHTYSLHWLFPDWPYDWSPKDFCLKLSTDKGPYYVKFVTDAPEKDFVFVRGDKNSPNGWLAPYYMARVPALSVTMNVKADSALIFTLFSPESVMSCLSGNEIKLNLRTCDAVIALGEKAIISSVRLSGSVDDELELA